MSGLRKRRQTRMVVRIETNVLIFLFPLGLIRCCLATDQKKLLPIRSATYWTEDGIISTDSERAAGRPFERQAASDGAERSSSHA